MASLVSPLIVSTLLLYSVAVYGVKVQNEKCLEVVQAGMEKNLGEIVPCIKSLGLDSPKERAKSYNCIMKCVLSKVGVLNEKGQISVIKGVSFILESFPNEYVEKALYEISKCQDYANIDISDPNDKYCIAMRPLAACGVEFMMNICSVD